MNQVIFCQAISTWFRKSMVSGSPLKLEWCAGTTKHQHVDRGKHCPIIVSDSLIYFNYNQPGVTEDSDIWKVEKKRWCMAKARKFRHENLPQGSYALDRIIEGWQSLVITSMRTDLGSRADMMNGFRIKMKMANGRNRQTSATPSIQVARICVGHLLRMAKKFTGSWGPYGTLRYGYSLDLQGRCSAIKKLWADRPTAKFAT